MRRLVAVVGVGCAGSPPPGCAGEGALELGTGEATFEPLDDGGPLAFHLGPQGGYHVYGALRTTGLAPGRADDPFGAASPRVTFLLEAADGTWLGALPSQPRLLEGDRGEAVLTGQPVVLAVSDVAGLVGSLATFSAGVEDRCGRTAEDEREVVLAGAR